VCVCVCVNQQHSLKVCLMWACLAVGMTVVMLSVGAERGGA